jgi:hypothetical protein
VPARDGTTEQPGTPDGAAGSSPSGTNCAAGSEPERPHTVDERQLGTIKRSDRTTRITYKDHPLLLDVRDKDDRDAYGEAIKSFGAEWYLLSQAGSKVDKA